MLFERGYFAILIDSSIGMPWEILQLHSQSMVMNIIGFHLRGISVPLHTFAHVHTLKNSKRKRGRQMLSTRQK